LRIGGQKIPFITTMLIASETLFVISGMYIGTWLQASLGGQALNLSWEAALLRFGVIVVVCELSLYYFDIWDLQIVSRRTVLVVRLLQAFGIACITLAMLYMAIPSLRLGANTLVFAAPVALFILVVWRYIIEKASPLVNAPERVLVLGTAEAGVIVASAVSSRPEYNMTIVGILEEPGVVPRVALSAPVIGTADELEEIVQKEQIERVVISLAERRGRMPVRELLQLRFGGLQIEDAHTVLERISGRIMIEHLSPSWLFMSEGFPNSRWSLGAKRTVDIVLSAIALILTAPLMLVLAIIIRLESPTSPLFTQERVGLHGRVFKIFKFRSMLPKPADAPPSWTSKNDNRITGFGRFIRKSRLDELPQFFNVLRGDMSLVGPRPEQPYFCEMLGQQIPYFALRHSVRPGITGWAQVKYGYGGTVEESKTKLEHDLFYIKHRSLTLDMLILFETAKVMIAGRGAA